MRERKRERKRERRERERERERESESESVMIIHCLSPRSKGKRVWPSLGGEEGER